MTLSGRFGDPKTERDILSAKRFNFFALIVLICTMAAAFLLYMQLLHKQQELETKSQQLADSTANLRRIRSELEAAQRSLSQRQVEMEQEVQSLAESVENRQFESAVTKAEEINQKMARTDSHGITLVHLYSWQPQPTVLRRIGGILKEPDYLLVKDETLGELPDWMGRQSAVYYYSLDAATKAIVLAQKLTALSGQQFGAVLGDSDDAPQQNGYEWMHIHYLGARLPVQE
jgi:hypothetical protein